MDKHKKESLLIDHFAKYMTDHKKEMVEQILSRRTRHVTLVLEDIFQSQNASATVRTCECFGIQDIHIIENRAKYETNIRVLKGSHKWITYYRYKNKNINNTEACFEKLREKGYRVLATDPSASSSTIDEVEVKLKDGPVAIVLGNELRGLSDYALTNCDQRVHIPMAGFTESLNISVSAAICLRTILVKLEQEGAVPGLTEEEKFDLRLNWYRKIVKKSNILEREFLRSIE